MISFSSSGWSPAADGWMVQAGASDPTPSLALATRPGGHTSQCTLTLALCHLHFAICTLPFSLYHSAVPKGTQNLLRIRHVYEVS